MILGTGCLGQKALDATAIRRALRDTGLRRALLVVADGTSEATARATGRGSGAQASNLQGAPVAGVRVAAGAVDRGVAVAESCRCPRLVIEPSASTGLEEACRQLHGLGRRHPGLRLALATPDAGPLADPRQLRLALEDLASIGLGYWHRPSRAALLGQDDAVWLDSVGRWLAGMSLDDVAEGQAGLPPGLGTLDFQALAEWLGNGLEVALDVGPVADVSLLRLTREQLAAAGFP